MMRRLLYTPIICWLLLPSGLCLSRLHNLWCSSLFGAAVTQPVQPAVADTDDDHSPSCPCNKMVYSSRASAPAQVMLFPPPPALELSVAPICQGPPVPFPLPNTLRFGLNPSEVYLSLRRLLI